MLQEWHEMLSEIIKLAGKPEESMK